MCASPLKGNAMSQLTGLKPREYAARCGVGVGKVLYWINTKQLRATNIATNKNGQRPRWLISEQHIQEFEMSRDSFRPKPGRPRGRNRRQADIIEFI